MNNPRNNNDPDQSNLELDENINNRVAKPAVNEVTTPQSHQDSYVQGRVTEKHIQENERAVREDRDTAWGPIIGIVLGSLVALGIASMFIFSPREESDTIIVPPAVEDSSEIEPEPSPTIIDRTRETIREVPVPSTPEQPDVNINVPQGDSSPAPAPAPAPAPSTTNNTNIEVTPSQPQSSPDAPAPSPEPTPEPEPADSNQPQ